MRVDPADIERRVLGLLAAAGGPLSIEELRHVEPLRDFGRVTWDGPLAADTAVRLSH